MSNERPSHRASDWWRDAVIYQIYPKSWNDADGDGYGDANGVRARLRYLADLGVDAVWFSPFYRSPDNDGGYDVADYRDIDRRFGTLGEVEALIVEAHGFGLKVLVDLVPNHTSSEHRFFQAALGTAPDSPEWARYHVAPGKGPQGELPPNNWRCVFTGDAWSPVTDADGTPTGYWYLHLFDSTQPDVNWENPDIVEEFDATIRFWLDRGVDGFRVDVAHGLVKAPGYPDSRGPQRVLDAEGALVDIAPEPFWDQPGVHEIYRHWRAITDGYAPARIFVGEIWVGTAARLAAYLRPDEMHSGFNFPFLHCNFRADELRPVVDSSLEQDRSVGASTTWVVENHDVPRVVNRYALNDRPRPDVVIAPGEGLESRIARTRLSESQDLVGRDRARAMMLLMLALPGSAYIYQGQELALEEVTAIPESERQDPAWFRSGGKEGLRDGCRVPLPWTRAGETFGFSGGTAWLTQPRHWRDLSIEAQTDDPASMLELTRKALRLRRELPALGEGEMHWRDDLRLGDSVLAFVRPGRFGSAGVLVVCNTGPEDVAVPNAGLILASSRVPLERTTSNALVIPADTAVWLAL